MLCYNISIQIYSTDTLYIIYICTSRSKSHIFGQQPHGATLKSNLARQGRRGGDAATPKKRCRGGLAVALVAALRAGEWNDSVKCHGIIYIYIYKLW